MYFSKGRSFLSVRMSVMLTPAAANVCANPEHHHFIDKIGTLNGVVSGFVLFPQIFVILFFGVPNNLTLLMILLTVFNNVIWFLYGYHRSILPTMIAAALNVVAGIALLVI